MQQSAFIIGNMDCPTEEALIRKRLGAMQGIGHNASTPFPTRPLQGGGGLDFCKSHITLNRTLRVQPARLRLDILITWTIVATGQVLSCGVYWGMRWLSNILLPWL